MESGIQAANVIFADQNLYRNTHTFANYYLSFNYKTKSIVVSQA